MKKTGKYLALGIAALLIAAVAALIVMGRSGSGKIAKIYIDGEVVEIVDLSVDRVIEIGDGNVAEVKNGEIRMISADCPDKICVSHGKAKSNSPIICLPNRVVVSVDAEDEG